ncbi:SpdD-like protein [Streptomyces bauhiniae]
MPSSSCWWRVGGSDAKGRRDNRRPAFPDPVGRPLRTAPAPARPVVQLTPGTAVALVGGGTAVVLVLGTVLVSLLLAVAITGASVAVCAVVLRSLLASDAKRR